MTDRVEKVTASKGTGYGRAFGQRHGYSDGGGGKAFQRELRQAIRKNTAAPAVDGDGAPYVVDVTRATQSLFYKDHSAISHLVKYLDGK